MGEANEDHSLGVVATAKDDDGQTAPRTSTATASVADRAPGVSKPTITGTPQEGQTLTASATGTEGDWPVSYQWQKNGVNISGATASTYAVAEGDEGATLDVVATAKNDNLLTASQTSAATATVFDQAASVSTPTITGTPQEGQPLTAAAASGAGESDDPVSYQWQRNGANISGATSSTYVVQESDEAGTLDVVATSTAEDLPSSASKTSAATATVFDQAASVSTPTITGTPQEGQTLTAAAASGAGESDDPVSYQWQRNGANISGATSSTYVVQESDEAGTLDVVATSTAEDNTSSASQTSAATATVFDQAASVSTPTITGTPQEGQTLTAAAASGAGESDVALAGPGG